LQRRPGSFTQATAPALPISLSTATGKPGRCAASAFMLPHVRLKRLADFALWATACEGAFRPAGTFEAACSNNRRAAIENIVDADPVAALVREIMADKAQWKGSASDLLQLGANRSGWPKNPRALAGRLRRAQSFLRTLGTEIVFGPCQRQWRWRGSKRSSSRTMIQHGCSMASDKHSLQIAAMRYEVPVRARGREKRAPARILCVTAFCSKCS
jgi:hypothetical protein